MAAVKSPGDHSRLTGAAPSDRKCLNVRCKRLSSIVKNFSSNKIFYVASGNSPALQLAGRFRETQLCCVERYLWNGRMHCYQSREAESSHYNGKRRNNKPETTITYSPLCHPLHTSPALPFITIMKRKESMTKARKPSPAPLMRGCGAVCVCHQWLHARKPFPAPLMWDCGAICVCHQWLLSTHVLSSNVPHSHWQFLLLLSRRCGILISSSS